MNRRNLYICLAAFAWWTLNGAAVAAQWMGMRDASGALVPWTKAVPASMVGAWGWLPFMLGLIWLARRFPIEPGRFGRSLSVHAMAVAAVVLGRAVFIYALNDKFRWYDQPPAFVDVLLQSVWNNLFQAWLVVGVAHALLFSERAADREQQATALQAQLADAKLAALSSQLNPHFLFNALNSIAELVHRDAMAADRMIVGLSALLRNSLDKAGNSEVPLDEELRLLEYYLDIEKIRLGERLRVDWEIAPEALSALVPPLLLQPLLENAVRHGISRRRTSGRIVVRARRKQGQLLLEVEDDGGELTATGAGTGIGLATTRARLECLYGQQHLIDLLHRPDGSTLARLHLPFRALRDAA